MRIRNACLGLVVLLIPALAFADSHRADVYSAFSSGGGGSNLSGFIVALGKTQIQPEQGPPKKVLLGGVGGASVQFGSHEGRDVTQVVWSAGPRVTFEKDRESRNFFHAQVTFGGVYTNDGQEPNDFATVVGAAYDFAFRPHAGATKHPGLGFRLQADRVFNMGDRDDVWRLSAGFVYRIPRL